MCLIVTLAIGNAGESAFAHWNFVYPYSGNSEEDVLYTQDGHLYYTRTQFDRSNGKRLSLSESMRLDNLRRVTINETTTEIHVQVWGILNTSVLVLHFNKTQGELAHSIAQRLEHLRYSAYFPMQKRAKMPVSNSSFAASPVS